MKDLFPEPGCYSCPSHSDQYMNRICNGGKKPRKFKSKDPKIKAASWCPKRNTPPIIKVYRFKDEQSEQMHYVFRHETQRNGVKYAHPETRHYMMAFESRQNITAKGFYEAAERGEIIELVDFELVSGDVVEIDSGLSQYHFYYQGYKSFLIAVFTPPKPVSKKEGK